MAKVEQALVLDPPAELHFKAPFTDVTTSYLNLTNPTEKRICFKVKTTAPKTYCVRPNNGIVAPKETVAIAVMLQPLDLETADKSKHKFMVQSMFVPDGDVILENLWREAPLEGLMNSKLKCVFDLPADNTQSSADPVESATKEKREPKAVPIIVPETEKPPTIYKFVEEESESKALQKENQRLLAQLDKLRQENSSLKEEGLRRRVAYDTRTRGTTAKPLSADSESSQLSVNKQPPTISNFLIALSVIFFILGIYLGKTIL